MSPQVTLDSVIAVAPGQVSAILGEEAVVLRFDKGVYYGLDEVAARIWQLLEEPTSVRDVCAVIVREYDVDEERCRADVLRFIRSLVGESLVEVSAAARG